jgi:hypothetical protein
MRTLLIATALMLSASPVWAKVIMNSFDEEGSKKARETMREEAIAKGEEVPLEAHEYKPPQNAWAASWAAAQAKLNQTTAMAQHRMQQNKVNNLKEQIAKAEKKGKPQLAEEAKAKLPAEEAELARLAVIVENHRISATEHWGTAKVFTYEATKGTGEEPIAGFEDDDK